MNVVQQKPVVSLSPDSRGRRWYRVDCATCDSGAIESTDAASLAGGRRCLACLADGEGVGTGHVTQAQRRYEETGR